MCESNSDSMPVPGCDHCPCLRVRWPTPQTGSIDVDGNKTQRPVQLPVWHSHCVRGGHSFHMSLLRIATRQDLLQVVRQLDLR